MKLAKKKSIGFFLIGALFLFCMPVLSQQAPNVGWTGLRSSSYGVMNPLFKPDKDHPFPPSGSWVNALSAMKNSFGGSPQVQPVGIWIVSKCNERANGTKDGTTLEFAGQDDPQNMIYFNPNLVDHHKYLKQFDETGQKVFLQVEPGYAPVDKLLNLVHKEFGKYKCVIGFGVDAEWNRNTDPNADPDKIPGCKVTDAEAQAWNDLIKTYKPEYRLFLKHWWYDYLPLTYRSDLIFVSDSQEFTDLSSFLSEMRSFAVYYKNCTDCSVGFQYGYPSDYKWYKKEAANLRDVPGVLGNKLALYLNNNGYTRNIGLFWVDFTMRNVWPDIFAPAQDFIGNWDQQGVYFQNSGCGKWEPLHNVPAEMTATGDLDGDGLDDLIGAWKNLGLWIRYTGAGQWKKIHDTAPKALATADMNANGRRDVLGSWDPGGVWYWDPLTGWQKLHDLPALQLAGGDFDRDGKTDLLGVWSNPDGIWIRLSSNGQWLKLKETDQLKVVTTADLNGDGVTDILGSWTYGVWWYNPVNGQWTRIHDTADRLTAGDLNGDAIDDLIGIWPNVPGVWVKYSGERPEYQWRTIPIGNAPLPKTISAGRLIDRKVIMPGNIPQ